MEINLHQKLTDALISSQLTVHERKTSEGFH